MELVGAALGDERHLAARGASLVGALSRDGGAELLHGIERNRQHGIEARDAFVVVDVHAVEGDVVLVRLGAEDLAAGGDARLEAQQRDDVAGLQRQGLDLAFGEGIADRSVLGVDDGGFRRRR